MVFHNEGFTVLMRTVHSVINNTPPQFLEEILLVDDYSEKGMSLIWVKKMFNMTKLLDLFINFEYIW